MNKPDILIVGAGINGLVAANYLQRSGCSVTMIERAEKVGGACVSEVSIVDGVTQHYALGASVLGLMQAFVSGPGWRDNAEQSSAPTDNHGGEIA